nr:unnamed protein product [Callosobruchus chinensis]CAH7730458.1 unnamed protein product [Callosobruchus chinensis]CAH7755073.1 unnamed protein product [Callosobruchus chinensis]CAH7763160.1 unnamed protein product [Callosobruchus chinensis]CAH7764612.1 unnamed protein product [Callosobruchus chinensis]
MQSREGQFDSSVTRT